MIIIYKGSFDHSNRLFQNIHFESFCLENNIRFYNLSFLDLKGLYGKQNSKLESFLYKAVNQLVKYKLIRKYDFNKLGDFELYNKDILKKGIKFCSGWYFHVDDLILKYQNLLRTKYTLKPNFYLENEFSNKLDLYKKSDIKLVGIHIRRGDYKVFEDGKYYYSNDVYLESIEQMKVELMEKIKPQKIVFILFSDEKITIQPTSQIIISRECWYIDQYCMSQCDYLIGPPSTFTLWASFVGKVPYYHLKTPTDNIKLDKFKTIDNQH